MGLRRRCLFQKASSSPFYVSFKLDINMFGILSFLEMFLFILPGVLIILWCFTLCCCDRGPSTQNMASTASVPENACYDGNHISLDLFHTELGFPKLPSPAPSSVLLPQQDRNNETLDNNTTEGGGEGPTCSICLCPS